MKLTLYGAARQVSGSCALIETDRTRVLVDCGLFQGGPNSYERSLQPFEFEPSSIDAVVLTHAHIDHIGRLPKLVREGFEGRVFATHPTRQLARLMWRDAAHVMKRDAYRYQKPRLYTKADVGAAYDLIHGVGYGTKVRISDDVSFVMREAGHIFGSAFVEFDVGGVRFTTSGDLGNDYVPILRQSSDIVDGDVIMMESTYGDRVHEAPGQRVAKLKRCVQDTIAKKGVLLIPAFSLERTQEILYELNTLIEGGELPRVPIFLDSPLAIDVLPIYREFPEYYDQEAKELKKAGDDFFKFPGLEITRRHDEGARILETAPPKVIIAGSGMMHGGRIMGHLAHYLNDPKTTVMVVGYQSPGTVGRAVMEGAKTVRIEEQEIMIRAQVEFIGAYSAHADQHKLLRWVTSGAKEARRVILNHGDPAAQDVLADKIRRQYGVTVDVPEEGQVLEIA